MRREAWLIDKEKNLFVDQGCTKQCNNEGGDQCKWEIGDNKL